MKFYIWILIVFFFSCNKEKNELKQELYKIGVESEFVSHFPEFVGRDTYSLTFNIQPKSNKFTSEVVYIYLEFEMENTDSILKDLNNRSLQMFRYEEECNLVVNKFQNSISFPSFRGKEWVYQKWLRENESCLSVKSPIPNFIGVGSNKNKSGLSEDFLIYVLDAKPGKHFEDKYYSDKIFMPYQWERGYSKGIAINEKTKKVIYWFICW